MDINFFIWRNTSEEIKNFIFKRAELDISKVDETVNQILDEVRKRGDEALIYYIEKFDGVKLAPEQLKVKEEEFERAEEKLSDGFKKAIKKNIENVKKFHETQIPSPMKLFPVSLGVYAGEKIEPIPSVGLYIPRGKGAFPSVLYMLAVPAVIAGVERIVIVTPPSQDGSIDIATLFTAEECNVKEIYRISGIQAIGALAYGTKTIPKVEKIIGPGSTYVAAAKRALFGIIDVGLPAGPSESLILADRTANPRNVALDFLTESEHGSDSASILVTDSEDLGREVIKIVPSLIEDLPSMRKNFIKENMSKYSGVVIVEDLNEAIDFVNKYAPEHLSIVTKNPFDVLPLIKNAGEILLGEYTPFSLANFSIGPNAVLPTGGFAKTFSPVSVRDFFKFSSVSYVTENGFKKLKDYAIQLADYEGFPSHAKALKKREYL
jgi:histidinol dehydrogenase